MHVALFGTFDGTRHPRVRVLEEGLLELGHDVTILNVPFGVDTAARVTALRKPWRLLLLVPRLLACWWRLWKSSRHIDPDVVVVGYLGHLDVHLARRRWKRHPIVLDHLISLSDTAGDRRIGGRLALAVLSRLDRWATRTADVVLVDTDEHAQLVDERSREKTLPILVGCTRTWFRAPARRAGGPLRVIFFGLFTPLHGATVVSQAFALLRQSHNIEATVVGTGQDYARCRQIASGIDWISWVSWIDSELLPEVVSSYDVCLGIFGTTPKAQRVVPNKAFQGAAAGCAVITSDTLPQRRAFASSALYVPPGDASTLAGTLQELAADSERTWQARRAAFTRASSTFTPSAIVQPLQDAFARIKPLAAGEPGQRREQ